MPENEEKALPGPRSVITRPLSEMTEAERKEVLDADRKIVEDREAAIAKAKVAPTSTTRRTSAGPQGE